MKWVLFCFQFYINCSIHVALAAVCFAKITCKTFQIPLKNPLLFFIFFGCIAGYNFIKYASILLFATQKAKPSLVFLILISLVSFFIAFYYFFQLSIYSKIISIIVFFVVIFYGIPLFPNKKNFRIIPKIKIYLVAFCWLLIGFLLPLVDAAIGVSFEILLSAVQRFLFLIVLLLLFEIVDSKKDSRELVTLPQQIGVKNTKIVGYFLMLFVLLIELLLFKSYDNQERLVLFFVVCMLTFLFLFFADENKARVYVSFWVEAIPIFWYILCCQIM